MATFTQIMRGASEVIDRYILPDGALSASTDTHDVQVHDGKTKGGLPLLGRAKAYTDKKIAEWKPKPISGIPAGGIAAFAFDLPPEGWLACSGQWVKIADYPELYAAIGDLLGKGDNADFRIPDLRGEFIRGWIAEREDIGSEKGRTFGSWQAMNIQKHQHEFTSDWVKEHNHWTPMGLSLQGNIGNIVATIFNIDISAKNGRQTGGGGAHNVHGWTVSVGGDETRPQNVALMYCIKY